jgi:CDP-diacylglycerol--glycerol-3-phosphate 3-phosphatidyltransferase/cardiolipin synthase
MSWVAFAVMMAAVAITLWTGVEYVIEALRLRAKGKRQAGTVTGQDTASGQESATGQDQA